MPADHKKQSRSRSAAFDAMKFFNLRIYMGLDTRKPVFCRHISPLFLSFWKVSYLNLLQTKLVSVTEETGLKLALSETPKTVFLALRPKYYENGEYA